MRLAACRPGYSFVSDEAGWSVECRNGGVIDSGDVSQFVRDEYEVLAPVLQAYVG